VSDESTIIPPPVRQFIADHIDSVMQLEVLLLLAAERQRAWTANDLAELLRIDPTWVDAQLRAMAAAGLVAQQADPAAFRFDPRTPELAQAVDELAKTYADRRVTVIGLIFAKPMDKIRSFADAFRIRKDKTD
jgi:DNA-binding HxlR family transcriptional regulator